MSIAVLGGNGFVGRKICEVGVRLGWSVTSLSRSGKPPAPIAHSDHSWMSQVKWEKADLFDPKSYEKFIANKSAVVHSVGILFENIDYKTSVNLNFNFLNDVQKLANIAKGSNPMARSTSTSYAGIQRDLAVVLADTFIKESKATGKNGPESRKPAFVYISADNKPPMVPEGYLSTKREAEFELSCKKDLRCIFMRPGFMFDPSEPSTNNRKLLSTLVNIGYDLKNAVFSNKVQVLNDLVRPPVSTENVALKVYEKLSDENFSGVVGLEEIAGLSKP